MTTNHLETTVSPQDKPILGVKHLLTEDRELMFIISSLGLVPEASTSFLSVHNSAGLLAAVAPLSQVRPRHSLPRASVPWKAQCWSKRPLQQWCCATGSDIWGCTWQKGFLLGSIQATNAAEVITFYSSPNLCASLLVNSWFLETLLSCLQNTIWWRSW